MFRLLGLITGAHGLRPDTVCSVRLMWARERVCSWYCNGNGRGRSTEMEGETDMIVLMDAITESISMNAYPVRLFAS